MKALWTRLLIVGAGEVDDGAFPSLAIGSTALLFEDLWRARSEANPEGMKRLDEALKRSPALARELARSRQLGAVLDVLDLRTGKRNRIERNGFGCWGSFASTSPDGSLVAIGCALHDAPRPGRRTFRSERGFTTPTTNTRPIIEM
ncbi:MAG: hypothetical protein JST54_06265 [Deltaproteobacteria bacterium]|nr:hypothetical protein [Deltaproteobacteria bacterium]